MPDPFDRLSGIGASDISAVLGLSPWQDAFSTYCTKLGLLPPREPSPQMLLGIDLEEGIGRAVSRVLGRSFTKPEPRRHPDHPWLYASPDGLFDMHHGLELKNVSGEFNAHADDWGDPGTDEVPDYVNVQCQQQMAVFGLDVVTVGALIAGGGPWLYEVPRHEKLIGYVVELAHEFWHEHVLARVPPQPAWGRIATADILAQLYPPREGKEIALKPEYADLASSYQELTRIANGHREAALTVKARLLYALGDAATGLLPDGRRVVRKTIQRRGYTCAPSEYILFKILEPKENHDGE